MLIPNQRRLKRQPLLRLLGELETVSEPAISVYIPEGLPSIEIEKRLGVVLNEKQILPAIVSSIAGSSTGTAIYWGKHYKYVVLPPFPITENIVLQCYDVELLRSLLEQDLNIALVLLRMGAYAIGVFQGESLFSSKVGTGLVHSRHKKGGSSAHRFERHRDKQIELFFSRVCLHTREKLEPHLQRLDYLYYGGENFTIRSFREQCRFSKKLDDHTIEALLNVREPKQASLEAAIGEVWSSRVTQWREDL